MANFLKRAGDLIQRAHSSTKLIVADRHIAELKGEVEALRRTAEMQALLLHAIRIAVTAHDGQVDQAGQAYIMHPLRVMLMGKTDEERIVGALHDVPEDCPDWPFERLETLFPPVIIDALKSVSKKNNEDYAAFVARASANAIGREVKINDIMDNLDPVRLYLLPQEKREKLDAKYHAALKILFERTKP